MRIITPSTEIINATPNLEATIERCTRVCYKSEGLICEGSALKIIRKCLDSHHESVLEHGAITVHFVVDRGITHEIVRHRIASFSQESTRYVCYAKEQHGRGIGVIKPVEIVDGSHSFNVWWDACLGAESAYLKLIDLGEKAQNARSVLPTCTKSEIMVTANPREWRWIFTKRIPGDAHPDMRHVMRPLLLGFQDRWPAIFGNLSFRG